MVMLAATEEAVTTMSEALINTAIGMGTVFVVLILISFIIYLLKFVPDLLNRPKKEPIPVQSVAVPTRPVPSPKPVTSPAPGPVSAKPDDKQLAAVIMAAVAAAMEEEGTPVPVDGLVIRSIKKRFRK